MQVLRRQVAPGVPDHRVHIDAHRREDGRLAQRDDDRALVIQDEVAKIDLALTGVRKADP